MKKFLKSILTLSLVGSILSTNVAVFAEETTEEEPATEEVATDEVVEEGAEESAAEEGEEVEALDGTITGELVENPEEVFALINEANQTPLSQIVRGVLSAHFSGGGTNAQLLGADYILTYNVEPRLSAEIDLMWSFVTSQEPVSFFAYIHNGQFLEHRDETWYSDDISAIEEMITEMLFNNTNGDQADLKAKYLNVYENETGYLLSLKEDINVDELYTDLDALYDFESVRESMREAVSTTTESQEASAAEAQLAIVDSVFSEERIKESLTSAQYQLIYNKETGHLLNNYFSLNVNVSDVYEMMGIDPSSAPSNLVVVSENSFSNHGEEFDFSFLDEVAPAE